MASVTKTEQESKAMAEAEVPKQDEGFRRKPGADGFFTIQKKGHGYWTRMGTAIGIGLLALFTAYNIFVNLPSLLPSPSQAYLSTLSPADAEAVSRASETLHFRIALISAAVFLVGFSLLGFWITNKPDNVEFLIATDSEMKKVNWTSRRDLIASTKIVIIFMFSVAVFLFVVDILFHYLFHIIGVLKAGPFGS